MLEIYTDLQQHRQFKVHMLRWNAKESSEEQGMHVYEEGSVVSIGSVQDIVRDGIFKITQQE